MPRGDKSKYTGKQERKADHIAESYESRGVPEKEAERRAWATVNMESGGGKWRRTRDPTPIDFAIKRLISATFPNGENHVLYRIRQSCKCSWNSSAAGSPFIARRTENSPNSFFGFRKNSTISCVSVLNKIKHRSGTLCVAR
jgi:hypothetical protein